MITRSLAQRTAVDLPDIRVGTPVTSVVSATPSGPVTVHASDGKAEYDAVILATHSDVSLRLVEQGAPKVQILSHGTSKHEKICVQHKICQKCTAIAGLF